jgi:hypothetical protein
MNYFKLIVGFLASASLVSSAADASHMPVPRNGLPRKVQVTDIMREGDNLQALAELVGERQLPGDSSVVSSYFADCIQYDRIDSFKFLLSRLSHEGSSRNENLTDLLVTAFQYGNIDFANIIMSQHFDIEVERGGLWAPHVQGAWRLEYLKQFITDHRDQAAALAPRNIDFKSAQSMEDVDVLIELAYHCAKISGQTNFDPTEALLKLLLSRIDNDTQLSQAALRLLQAGADNTSPRVSHALTWMNQDNVQTIELLRNWIPDEVKITEEDAELMCG